MILALFVLTALTAASLTAAGLALVALGRLAASAAADRERLYAAWKEGYVVPPTAATEPALRLTTEDVAQPLIPELQAIVNDWDDERGRAAQLRVIRAKLAQGRTQMEVLRELLPANEDVFVPDVAVEVA